jgi:hypothetical protein
MELVIISVNNRELPVNHDLNQMNFTMKTMYRTSRIFQTVIFSAAFMLATVSCEVDDLIGNSAIVEIEGEWLVDEESEIFGKSTMKSTLATYTVTISADPENTNGIIIDNFYNVGISVRANVSGSSITIPNQNAEDGYSVYGSGTISGNRNTINMSYTVNDGSAQDDNCTAVMNKN